MPNRDRITKKLLRDSSNLSIRRNVYRSTYLLFVKVSGLDLVYGEGSIGLMGLVTKAVHLGGGPCS